ncbi:hypothetical protein FDECE_10732 [Fusarium decemcellulare]|nr:hypothetical protein FDECE_10732 [Fusarium decemcellulare]
MPRFSAKDSAAAARAAHAYLSGASGPPTTRGNPDSSARHTIKEVAALHHAKPALTKKYIYLIKSGKPLPSDSKGGTPTALTGPEEKALVAFIRSVENSAFAVTEAAIRNYASFLREYRFDGPQPPVSQSWVRRLKRRHQEIQCKLPKVKEVTRAGAEIDIQHIEDWFKEFDAVLRTLGIKASDLWNFDETPLQIGWINGSVRIFSTRMKRNTRPTVFQPGNKESLTSVDAISAGGRSIPSFLVLSAKVLLEEYTRADIDHRVVLTFTESGFNNNHRALQWLQHFNHHSFRSSDSFKGYSIKQWFGFSSKLTREKYMKKVLLMDSFAAHENPEFIWYCQMFDIIPFRLPSHTSHILQPLDVGVYQHLKKEQWKALSDFMIAGGVRISRVDFLNQWNRIYPVNPELVLRPLREYVNNRQKPMFLSLLKKSNVTPRKAKRQLLSIRKDLEVLASPAKRIVRDVESCLDLAIRKVEARDEEERKEEIAKQARQQKKDLQKLQKEEAASWPRLRGGAAVKAKREREAAAAAFAASQEVERVNSLTEAEKEVLESRQRAWKEADAKTRDFYYHIWPRTAIEEIPEVAAYAAAREGHEGHEAVVEDFISVSSGSEFPNSSSSEESSDDEIEIITTTQIESTTETALAAGMPDHSSHSEEEEEEQLPQEDWGAWGYDRVPNSYSDEERIEPVIVVGGVEIAVPPSRARD